MQRSIASSVAEDRAYRSRNCRMRYPRLAGTREPGVGGVVKRSSDAMAAVVSLSSNCHTSKDSQSQLQCDVFFIRKVTTIRVVAVPANAQHGTALQAGLPSPPPLPEPAAPIESPQPVRGSSKRTQLERLLQLLSKQPVQPTKPEQPELSTTPLI